MKRSAGAPRPAPADAHEETPLWRAMDAAVADLEATGGLTVSAPRRHVLGYLCAALVARLRAIERTEGRGADHAPKLGLPRVRRSRAGRAETTVPGYTNPNGQVVVRTGRPAGYSRRRYIYVLRCTRPDCGHEYGAGGPEIHRRRCPQCQGGPPGRPY